MNSDLKRFVAAALVAGYVLVVAPAARAQGRDEIRQALFAGSYDKAVALALNALKTDPGNAEIQFLLARAYGYAGRWDEAEAILDRLLAEHPADADLLVFKARMLTWRKDLAGAERIFGRALEVQPRSADALAGLADLASWRGEYDAALVYARRALDLDANHAGALFRVGSILLWQGDYGRARGYLARAAELEPLNRDFTRALANAVPVYARRTEVWVGGRTEHWNDGRPDGWDLGLSALFSILHDRARLVVNAERLWRGEGRDDRFSVQAYPQLWKGAYAYLDLAAAPGAESIPGSSGHLEIYQSFLKKYEVSLGAGWIKAAGTDGVTVVDATAAAYLGSWYPNLRVQWSDAGSSGTELSWTAGLRRFLADTSYLWASVGRGRRTFEAGTVEEILSGPAWFFEAGADVYVFKNVKLRGSISRRSAAAGPSSTAMTLITGYRF
jgi:YaiO family outer membrane protein